MKRTELNPLITHTLKLNNEREMAEMKTKTYNIVITGISKVHGEYPGSIDVSFHRELDGVRDGFENTCVAMSDKIINPDGSINQGRVESEVVAAVGTTEEIEVS